MEAQNNTTQPIHTQNPNNSHQQPSNPNYDRTQEYINPPLSSVTSPSHEFSFTISFNSWDTIKCNSRPAIVSNEVDFSPADDIFFHGHLLPLHLLSHPTKPPHISTEICMENFSLPLEHVDSDRNLSYNAGDIDIDDENLYHDFKFNSNEAKDRMKSKPSLSSIIFGFAKLKKLVHDSNGGLNREDIEDKRSKRRKGFHVKRLLKKYVSIMDTFFSFKSSAEKSKRDIRRRPYSFSGHSNRRDWESYRRKGQFSAPASMRTSPTNSGLLSATSATFSSSDDSTMEELQSAIQAAIAHCKNSVAAVKEENK